MAKELKPLTIVVVEKESKEGRKFMTAKVRAEVAYAAGARIKRTSLDENINFDVKLAKATCLTLPSKEGIYEVDFAKAFEDVRPDTKRPTLWLTNREGVNIQFVYKMPLPTDPSKKSNNHDTICITDEE